MSLVRLTEPAVLWLAGDKPSRMVWRSRHWRITDEPTPLYEEVYHELLTHPARHQIGWRFQVSDEWSDTHVVDVRTDGDEWFVTAVYD
ncbi:MAG TPA: hypothetical protein VGC45_15870 [Gryllotalpicola sp.]